MTAAGESPPIATHDSMDLPMSTALQTEYAVHRAAKEKRVRAMLEEAGFGAPFRGITACPVDGGYRTHASFRAAHGAEGVLTGVDPRVGRVPLADALWVLPEAGRRVVQEVMRVLEGEGLLPPVAGFDVRLEHGSLRAHVTLSVPREAPVRLDAACERMLREVPGLLGIAAPGQGIALGEAHLRNVLRGREVLAHHLAFFQTNAHVTPTLCDEVQRGWSDPASVVDVYCGVGMHSILAAGPATRIRGADNNPWAIESAVRNAALHGLADAEYLRVDAERYVRSTSIQSPAVVVVNPSRFGCGADVAAQVARWAPERVCLVSCAIASHVRDTQAFIAAGYRPEAVTCFDMFPFSDFLESVTHFVPA
jgi:tRNA/tmRNA/rRNA uracil-C5-methylase (TrmA/RlmC/RlmD family)